MPWPVYTERLMQVSEVNKWRGYLVKPGRRMIVKHVVATNAHPTEPLQVHVLVNGFYVAAFTIRVPYEAHALELLCVGYEGEQLQVFLQGNLGFCVITGWVLDDPIGNPNPNPGAGDELVDVDLPAPGRLGPAA